ncbi:MAG TPA: 2-phospho-L-lactate transferase [Solirubrobacteraceae bacterium]|jgi:LPPG:FO 2-phospho-L-lactate transferase|nr:2-phospho-L-lactate transferase [Solirubrobacteraceae bacterium]
MTDGPVVILAGGTGGAKLARGMLDVVDGENLVVIANTGDDVEIYGAYVSPDPDLITFWLCDRIDDRGWGLRDDTFNVMDGMRELGVEVWFSLGDRDLAIGLERTRALDGGARLTDAQAAIAEALGVRARVLPMSDRPVRTRVLADDRWWPLQEFLIKRRGEGEVLDVDFRGRGAAPPTPELTTAIANARAIVIGPSNPVISIGPILALNGVRQALRASPAPVVAVSPIVNQRIVKGPTAAFMRWRGRPLTSEGIVAEYDGLLDGLVADQPTPSLPVLNTDVLMDSTSARRRLAEQTLEFALGLA